MRFKLILPIVALITLTGCMSNEEIQQALREREQNCKPLATFKQGDFVKVRVSNQKGQVISPQRFTYSDPESSGFETKPCDKILIRVRVDTHGVAHDGGLWSSARPEVLPIIKFRPFELSYWEQTKE